YYSESYGPTGVAFASIAGVGIVGGGFAFGAGSAVVYGFERRRREVEEWRRREGREDGLPPEEAPDGRGEQDWFDK
ncbi:MAG: hypothetical protein HY608_09350, partial [Planctomycetes bacterium]|nr:hypothetical protein [Planctomycetota bacterium]